MCVLRSFHTERIFWFTFTMEVEAEAEPLEPVAFVEAGDSGWDLKSCRRNPAPKHAYLPTASRKVMLHSKWTIILRM